jgi:sterol desaturase/sphingolipid hydroxylase (fatty acid hydroxylase superfamily)
MNLNLEVFVEALPLPASLSQAEAAVAALTLLTTLAIFVEMAFDALTRRARNWRETLSTVMVAVPNQLVSFTVLPVVVGAGLTVVSRFAVADLGFSPLVWLIGFFVLDFTYYWEHRIEHRMRVLWAHHSVHHSSTDYDLSTSARIAWHDGFLAVLYLTPAALLGFHPLMLAALMNLVLLYQVWVHTQKIDRVPLIEGWLNTPAAHRAHHASNAPLIDRNYGGVLMIWDRLFGTWAEAPADEVIRYGLTVDTPSINPLQVNFGEYVHIARQLRRCSSLREVALTVFGPPEWTLEHGFAATRTDSAWRKLPLA